MSMVVLSQGDVFHSSLLPLQVPFYVFEEPGLIVQSNSIDLSKKSSVKHSKIRRKQTREGYLVRLSVVRHGARHDYSRVQSVLDALNKRVLLVARGFGETLADVLQASDRLVLQLHPRLGGYDLDLCCDQEAQGSTGPGDSMEEVRVLLLGVGQRKVAGSCFMHSTLNVLHIILSYLIKEAHKNPHHQGCPCLSLHIHLSAADQAAVSQNQLVGHADVLKEAVDVGGTLDAGAHHQPTCRQDETFISEASFGVTGSSCSQRSCACPHGHRDK